MHEFDLFISYSHNDSELVEPLSRLLGISCRVFRDSDAIEPGERWSERLEAALRGSEKVLLIWCCHAASRPWVAKELELAKEADKRVIPVLVCAAPLPDYAKEHQWIDFRGRFQHDCSQDHGNVAGVLEEEPHVVSLEHWAFTVGLKSIDRKGVDAAWKALVRRNRFGAVVKLSELWALALVVGSFSLLGVELLGLRWPVMVGMLGTTAALAELIVAVHRWRRFAAARDLGLEAGVSAKILALGVSRIGREEISGGQAGAGAGVGGCGCLIVIIAVVLLLLLL